MKKMRHGCLTDFENAFFEVETKVEMSEKIESEQSFDRTFRREIMTKDGQVADHLTQAADRTYRQLRDKFDTAGSHEFNALSNLNGIVTDGSRRLDRNDRCDSACVQSASNGSTGSWAHQFNIKNNGVVSAQRHFNHKDKKRLRNRAGICPQKIQPGRVSGTGNQQPLTFVTFSNGFN